MSLFRRWHRASALTARPDHTPESGPVLDIAGSAKALPSAFFLLLVVQILSALADNAFLIVAIARLIELGSVAWLVPILKISASFFYVALAPFVGPLSDAFPKGRVMFAANLLKVFAVLMMIGGVNPVLAIGLAGVGAAIYAPAKYGLVTELLPAQDLVRANGYFESATVCAVILGTAIGGFLISPAMPALVMRWPWDDSPVAHTALFAGLLVLLALNGLALVLSAAVKDTGARYDAHPRAIGQNVRRFWDDNRQLWQDRLGGISMSVTTLLWAVGATMQLIILRWANESLGMSLTHAAYLQGVTAVGAICGAVLASRAVVLARAIEVMPVGILMGVLLPALLLVHQPGWAVVLLVTLGVLAGFVVVPMNAVLQHRGCTLLSAGCSIAVQGFNENGGMLILLGLYAVTVALALPLNILIFGFGVLVACGMAAIYFRGYATRRGAPVVVN